MLRHTAVSIHFLDLKNLDRYKINGAQHVEIYKLLAHRPDDFSPKFCSVNIGSRGKSLRSVFRDSIHDLSRYSLIGVLLFRITSKQVYLYNSITKEFSLASYRVIARSFIARNFFYK